MKNGWDSQNPGLGTQKLDAFLLNTLQTEARDSHMNLTGYLTCRSSQKHTHAASTPHILSSRNQQNSQESNKMARVNPYISIIPLNLNELNSLTKVGEWIRKKKSSSILPTRDSL